MEENNPKSKTKSVRLLDRVTLDSETLEKIDSWIAMAKAKERGTRVTRRDIVNWWIKRGAKDLTKTEEHELIRKFYDAEFMLKEQLKDIKLAKARGENLSPADISGILRLKNFLLAL